MNIRFFLRAFLAILVLGVHNHAVLSTAQEPPAPGVAQPGGGGGVNIDGPIEAPPATADLEKMGMALPNASIIKVVLPTYQQLTGKRVILDTNIADNQVRVVVNGPISKADLIDFIERTLLVNGFVFVPTNKENTVKLINATGGVPVRGGLPVFTDGTTLPDTDQVITYVMTLDYIKPEEAVRIFPQVIQLNSYGAIASVPNASAVIISEDTAIVRQLVALKALVDVPSGKIGTKWFVLERADAEKAAEFLNKVLETEGDDTMARPSQAVTGADATAPPPAGGAGSAPASDAGTADAGGVGESPKIKIIADIRRNSVLAVARPLDLSYIESLIKEYDSPSKARTFMKYSLKFITATEFLPTVENALARDLGDESGAGNEPAAARTARPTRRAATRRRPEAADRAAARATTAPAAVVARRAASAAAVVPAARRSTRPTLLPWPSPW